MFGIFKILLGILLCTVLYPTTYCTSHFFDNYGFVAILIGVRWFINGAASLIGGGDNTTGFPQMEEDDYTGIPQSLIFNHVGDNPLRPLISEAPRDIPVVTGVPNFGRRQLPVATSVPIDAAVPIDDSDDTMSNKEQHLKKNVEMV